MKKKLVKVISFVMAMVITIGVCFSVNAQGEKDACPIIDIHGLMASKIYAEAGNKNSEIIWPLDPDNIISAVEEGIAPISSFLINRDWDKLTENTTKLMKDIFGRVISSPDGSIKDGSGVVFNYPDKSIINKDSVLSFVYDWRLDPILIADQLNDFINYVIDASGCEKVNITCHSFGGVVTNTYLTIYGNSKVRSVMFNATAIYGETYNGELFCGKLVLNSDALEKYLRYAFDGNENAKLLNTIMSILNKSGIFDIAVNLGNDIFEKIGEEVSRETIIPLFAGWLSIWSMVPDEFVDEAEKYVFDTIYGGTHQELKAKVENFNSKVRSKKTETLIELNKTANVYVISRYGYSSLPITPSYNNLGDGVIDAKYSSFGATTGQYETPLSDEYLATADEKYVSPDKLIDASTCLFPEQTWFIKGMKHSENGDTTDEFIYQLLRYDGQATVDTFETMPRFNQFDIPSETITPLVPVEEELTLIGIIKIVIERIVNLIKAIFTIIVL